MLERQKTEFVFWEIFEQAREQCRSTSAAAYAALLGLREFRSLKINLAEKDIQEIIIIAHAKFVKDKIARVLTELQKAAKKYKGHNTGAKTLLSRLRRQALLEIQNIQKLTYVNDLYDETDNAESAFFSYTSYVDTIDIYDKDTLSRLLATQPFRRQNRPKMRPLPLQTEQTGEKGGAA